MWQQVHYLPGHEETKTQGCWFVPLANGTLIIYPKKLDSFNKNDDDNGYATK